MSGSVSITMSISIDAKDAEDPSFSKFGDAVRVGPSGIEMEVEVEVEVWNWFAGKGWGTPF